MNLRRLLLLQAIVTSLSFIAFVSAPTSIPASFDIYVTPSQYTLCYLLGAGELALAYLSLATRRINDPKALRAIVTFFIIFHAATGLLALYSVVQGASSHLLTNVALRGLLVALFYYYGYRKPVKQPKTVRVR